MLYNYIINESYETNYIRTGRSGEEEIVFRNRYSTPDKLRRSYVATSKLKDNNIFQEVLYQKSDAAIIAYEYSININKTDSNKIESRKNFLRKNSWYDQTHIFTIKDREGNVYKRCKLRIADHAASAEKWNMFANEHDIHGLSLIIGYDKTFSDLKSSKDVTYLRYYNLADFEKDENIKSFLTELRTGIISKEYHIQGITITGPTKSKRPRISPNKLEIGFRKKEILDLPKTVGERSITSSLTKKYRCSEYIVPATQKKVKLYWATDFSTAFYFANEYTHQWKDKINVPILDKDYVRITEAMQCLPIASETPNATYEFKATSLYNKETLFSIAVESFYGLCRQLNFEKVDKFFELIAHKYKLLYKYDVKKYYTDLRTFILRETDTKITKPILIKIGKMLLDKFLKKIKVNDNGTITVTKTITLLKLQDKDFYIDWYEWDLGVNSSNDAIVMYAETTVDKVNWVTSIQNTISNKEHTLILLEKPFIYSLQTPQITHHTINK